MLWGGGHGGDQRRAAALEGMQVDGLVVDGTSLPAAVQQSRALQNPAEIPMAKTNTTIPEASPMENTAPPVLLTKPEERTDAPIPPEAR